MAKSNFNPFDADYHQKEKKTDEKHLQQVGIQPDGPVNVMILDGS